MKSHDRFNAGDVGCYTDGALGHEHVREVLLSMYQASGGVDAEIIAALSGDMSDDAWEETAALDHVNDHACVPGVRFDLFGGDLMLLTDSEWEDA